MKAITVEPHTPGSACLENVAEPDVRDGSMLVEAVAVGVCGTDVEIVEGKYGWAPAGKKRCKLKLQQDLNLDPGKDTPLFGIIARLAHQKGLDLIHAVADGILHRGGQIALLGTGEKSLEAAFRELGALHPGRVAAVIGYDEGLAHRIEAGADIFLMPSRFEPCGLNQLYSLRYGTVPIVHATGGLKDTVEDGVTGFVFQEPTPHALWLAIERALHAYADAKAWQRMMRAGMKRDFSWEKSAREYAALYRGLLG